MIDDYLIDLRDVDRSPSVCRYLCGSGPGLPARPS